MDTGGSIGNTIFLTKGCRRFIRYSFPSEDSRGVYAIRSYSDERKEFGGSISDPIFLTKRRKRSFRYSFLFGDICGAYAIRPYPDGRMDTGGSISDPVIPVKGFVYLWRVSHSLDEGRSERRQTFLFYQ